MASIINASTTSTSGLVQTADASGVLQLQSNGVTGLTVGPGGLLTAANGMVFSSMTLGSAVAGEFEYDGRVPYFTPAGTQRGVVPGMQYFRLNSDLAGANINTAQNIFGVGITLSASTVYQYEIRAAFTKSAGTTSHALQFGFGGTAAVPGNPGTANRGGGGGGQGNAGSSNGGAGGSGVVIISYQNGSQRGTGGSVTSYSSGGNTYWVHTFTTSGTFTA